MYFLLWKTSNLLFAWVLGQLDKTMMPTQASCVSDWSTAHDRCLKYLKQIRVLLSLVVIEVI